MLKLPDTYCSSADELISFALQLCKKIDTSIVGERHSDNGTVIDYRSSTGGLVKSVSRNRCDDVIYFNFTMYESKENILDKIDLLFLSVARCSIAEVEINILMRIHNYYDSITNEVHDYADWDFLVSGVLNPFTDIISKSNTMKSSLYLYKSTPDIDEARIVNIDCTAKSIVNKYLHIGNTSALIYTAELNDIEVVAHHEGNAMLYSPSVDCYGLSEDDFSNKYSKRLLELHLGYKIGLARLSNEYSSSRIKAYESFLQVLKNR